MAITNVSKPSSTVTNNTKINIGETWASITTTWATEPRTWDATQSLISNVSRTSSSVTNVVRPT